MYAPPEGPVHKRAAVTLEGFFVGVQHPMALIIRKSDMKLISVSKKKVKVYEGMYTVPLHYSSAKLHTQIDDIAGQPLRDPAVDNKPAHIQSVKSVSAHTIPVPNTTAHTQMRPPTLLDESAATQSQSPGEGVVRPEHLSYDSDLATGFKALKEKQNRPSATLASERK